MRDSGPGHFRPTAVPFRQHRLDTHWRNGVQRQGCSLQYRFADVRRDGDRHTTISGLELLPACRQYRQVRRRRAAPEIGVAPTAPWPPVLVPPTDCRSPFTSRCSRNAARLYSSDTGPRCVACLPELVSRYGGVHRFAGINANFPRRARNQLFSSGSHCETFAHVPGGNRI